MYGKCAKLLVALAIVLLSTWNPDFFMKTDGGNAYHTKDECFRYSYQKTWHPVKKTTSEPRVIKEETMIRKRISNLSESDYNILCRIVQAEAGGEDMLGKQMVADVIINRVDSEKFPNTIEGVVFQGEGGKTQFSPISDGRYYTVNVTDETKNAVNNAISGSDSTNGSLYFVNASKADPQNLAWFENCLTYQTEHGGHRFYK